MMRGELLRKQDGQALVLFALILTFVLMLTLAFVEISGRYYQLAQVEDALKQATRSSVQTFDYPAFAENGVLIETHATKGVGCYGITPDSVRYYACKVLLTNLGDVSGLLETPEQTAARVGWTFLPQGGTCTYPNGQQVTFSTPAVCAALQPRMAGLIGFGTWQPWIYAADTLDHVE